jgi:4'-phosphopantetheinyl transferase
VRRLIDQDMDPSDTLTDWSNLQSGGFQLSVDEVHIWHALLEERLTDRLQIVLSEDERARADRFHFKRDRNHFIVARGLLRTILASYLKVKPIDLMFRYGEKGKPTLMDESGDKSVKFNLAHSQGIALFAFSRNREIGVDLEFIRDDLAGEDVAERFFSQTEVTALKEISPEKRTQAFFNCWTRKEAYIKACGEGLSMPLNEFDVSLVPGDAAALLKTHRDPKEALRWSMQSIPVETGYVAALVVEGSDVRPRHFYLPSTIA